MTARGRLAPLVAALLFVVAGAAAPAEEPRAGVEQGIVVATRAVPSRTVLTPQDITLSKTAPGAGLASIDEAVGQETRVALYAGRPIRPQDIGPPALIERNDLVVLVYRDGGLLIRAEGRALDRGGEGERVRAMNLGSRRTVTGAVAGPGLIEVGR